MHKIQLKETRQIGRVLDKQSKFRGWSGMIGVCNSIFPLENLRYAIILVQKRKSSDSKNVVIPDKKIVFPFFSQKVPVYFITPRQKFSFLLFHHSSSAPDQNENTRFCKNEWVLEINVMWIGFYYSASCDSLTGAETGWRRLNPYRKRKEKRNERNKEKNLSRSFFHCDWTRKGAPECLSIPLSSPRVTRLFSCLNSDGGQRWENL